MKNKITQGKIKKVSHVCRAKDSSHSYTKHLILNHTNNDTSKTKNRVTVTSVGKFISSTS